MQTYTIHRIGLLPLLKYGFLFGLIGAIPPVVGSVLIVRVMINQFSNWLDTLTYQIELPLIQDIEVNLLSLVGLDDFYATISNLANLSWLQLIILILGLIFLIACFSALLAFIIGIIFNLFARISGGLSISMSATRSSNNLPVASSMSRATQEQIQALPTQVKTYLTSEETFSRPRLEITQPIVRTIFLTQPKTVIGSDPSCQVQIDGLHPQHAQITHINMQYILTDLSRGQTWLQGHPVQEERLTIGQTIQLGHYMMIFRG